MSESDYLIQPPPPPEQSQLREHQTVAQRARRAEIVAVISIGIALVALYFSYRQWKAADSQAASAEKQADIADRALKLAEKSAAEQKADIERSRTAAENSATAAKDLARTTASMADTMRKQSELASKQNEDIENQASARLVFKKLRYSDLKNSMVAFDIVNVGNSEAIQVGVDNLSGLTTPPQEVPGFFRGSPDAVGKTLERGESMPFEFGLGEYQLHAYAFYRFTYRNIFGRIESTCGIIRRGRREPEVSPCPLPHQK